MKPREELSHKEKGNVPRFIANLPSWQLGMMDDTTLIMKKNKFTQKKKGFTRGERLTQEN